jgi:hypothetical protein
VSTILEQNGGNQMLAGFLMMSFHFNEDEMEYEYRTNLPELEKGYELICSKNFSYGKDLFTKNVRVVGSERAKYIQEHDVDAFEDIFPNFNKEKDLLMLDTNHWVHFSKFEETKNHLLPLFSNS